MNIHAKLSEIQRKLHAPKTQRNKFGNYDYRSCEDILKAVKPLLGDCSIVISDDIFSCAERIYIKATATISDGNESVSSTAFAREPADKKGMDVSQISGSSSSYSRKYALNGLLLIDDNKDADSMDNSSPKPKSDEEAIKKIMMTFERAESSLMKCLSIEDLERSFEKISKYYGPNINKFRQVKEFMEEMEKVKGQIKLKLQEDDDENDKQERDSNNS